MKSIMLSLSPYWYYLIGEGIKKIEVRKTVPTDSDWNKQVECYMTKDMKSFARIPKDKQEKYRAHFGKAGMQFVCDKVWERPRNVIYLPNAQKDYLELLKMACLTEMEALKYMGGQYNKDMYFWHISDLKIYDKPRELGEFRRECKQYGAENPLCDDCRYFDCCRGVDYDESDCVVDGLMPLTRVPQSWCYVEEL